MQARPCRAHLTNSYLLIFTTCECCECDKSPGMFKGFQVFFASLPPGGISSAVLQIKRSILGYLSRVCNTDMQGSNLNALMFPPT
ncbi:hypothetical protein F5Y17DRAFT_183162 [Xylariaceae sp. FL0594]|nr:hypothetical protein F5Y17DRAFT_183162 [Xylariaceae sp. FL0594]